MSRQMTKLTFVKAGEPLAVMGAATRTMARQGDALVVGPDDTWGNPLFADRALEEADFHIHARLTLDTLSGDGASFLLGGFYHYPSSRPEGNRTLRISFDDEMASYDPYRLEPDSRIVYGMTERRAPWSSAERTIAGRTTDFIEAGKPFVIDVGLTGSELSCRIDGREILRTVIRQKGWIFGCGDGGWPVCFGFLPDGGVMRVHELSAEGTFAEVFLPHQDVWTLGHEGYFTYRIPSLCTTTRGNLLAFAEARRSDFRHVWGWRKDWNPDDVHCVMKRSCDGGRTWSPQRVLLARGTHYEARDPSPLVDRDTGTVFLMLRGPYLMTSDDEGKSWSGPRSLRHSVPDGAGMLSAGPANSGIQLRHGPHAGRLVYAVEGGRNVGVVYSDDHGETWQLGGMTEGGNAHEPQLTELTDGRILVNARDHTENPGRLICISDDGGGSFETQYDDRLPSKACQASLMRLHGADGLTEATVAPILFCGPGKGRSRLTVKWSNDECGTWAGSRIVYAGQSAYSAMTTLPNGEVGILYERDGYRRLSLARFRPDWLTG